MAKWTPSSSSFFHNSRINSTHPISNNSSLVIDVDNKNETLKSKNLHQVTLSGGCESSAPNSPLSVCTAQSDFSSNNDNVEFCRKTIEKIKISLNPQEFLQIIGDCDENFTGLKVMFQRFKLNSNSSKDILNFLQKKVEIEEYAGKQMKKNSLQIQENLQHCLTKQGTFGKAWGSVLNSHLRCSEKNLEQSRKNLEYCKNMEEKLKRMEKDSKQLKNASELAIKEVQTNESNLKKIKAKLDSANEDFQLFSYQNQKNLSSTPPFSKSQEKYSKITKKKNPSY